MNAKDIHINKLRLAKFNGIVANNSTLSPYLLFPLRLETQFRTAVVNTRPDYSKEVDIILIQFNDIISQLEQIRMDEHIEIDASLREVTQLLYELNYNISTLDIIPGEDKGLIINLATQTKNLFYSFSLGDYQKIMFKHIEDIIENARNISISNQLTRNAATHFLNKLEKEFTSLNTLCTYSKTPYRSKAYYKEKGSSKEKNHKLYQYIDNRLNRLSKYFEEASKDLDKIIAFDNKQKKKAKNDLFANNANAWIKLFSEIKDNLFSIYTSELNADEEKKLREYKDLLNSTDNKWHAHQKSHLEREIANREVIDFKRQREELEKEFNEKWNAIITKLKSSCTDFITKLKHAIETKPKIFYSSINLAYKLSSLRIELVRNSYISKQKINNKIAALNHIINLLDIVYADEKDKLLQIITKTEQSLKHYAVKMKSKNFIDYNTTTYNYNIDKSKVQNYKNLKKTYHNEQKQLCVRIFPDDIFIHQHDKDLTKEEWVDAKRFWIEWFIASDTYKYQKQAWNQFWRKYGAMRAGWIARSMSIINLKSHQAKYPFKDNNKASITLERLQDISNELKMIPTRKQSINENQLKNTISKMLPRFYDFRKIVMQYDLIVDYLFDEFNSGLNYVKKKLDIIHHFYSQNPHYKEKEFMSYRDEDYLALTAFYEELTDLIEHLKHKRVSIKDMVDEYLKEDLDGDFFPVIKQFRKSDWHESPQSAIMPERFLFIGHLEYKKGDKTHTKQIKFTGRKVNPNLQLGFDPFEGDQYNQDFDNPIFEPYELDRQHGEIAVKGGLEWMTDYETAVKEGMAITVPLPKEYKEGYNHQFKSIYILGVKEDNSQEIMEEFFNGHIYGQSGMDLINVGVPTNSLDGIVSGFNSDEELIEEQRFHIDVQQDSVLTSKDFLDAMSLVLGMNKSMFEASIGRVTNYNSDEISKAKNINKKLSNIFKSNFSYPINTHDPSGEKDNSNIKNHINDLLKHIPDFISNFALARGISPSLRVGNQPYGIMPTTAFSLFKIEAQYENVFARESNISGTDLERNKEFVKFSRELHLLLQQITAVWHQLKESNVIHSENLGTGVEAHRRFMEMTGLTPISIDYFERSLIEMPALLHSSINIDPLNRKNINISSILENVFELSDQTETISKEIKKRAKLLTHHPVQDMVQNISIDDILNKKNIKSIFSNISEEEQAILLAEFLDLFTYRLDAWWLGLVNYQLSRIRSGVFGNLNNNNNAKSANVSLGAFGWLFNLKEKKRTAYNNSKRIEIANEMNLSKKDQDIFQDQEDQEFIMAPSYNHAITAAVLRSAYLKSSAEGDDTRMSINLSSLRVRQALKIIEGVKNGLSMGAILGAELERNLHEAYKIHGEELDRYIYPLRKLFPLKVDLKSEQEGEDASNYLMTIINGESLLMSILPTYEESLQNGNIQHLADFLTENELIPEWFKDLFIDRSVNHKKIVARIIEQMADAQDALADLILSEGVYQLVQGNRVAFKAWINNLEDGHFSTNPEMTELPMESAMVQYKVGQMLNTNLLHLDYMDFINNPMTKAEPGLNNWLKLQLGNLNHVQFSASIIIEEDGEASMDKTIFSLADLNISEIEYFHLSDNLDLFKRYLEYNIRLKEQIFKGKIDIDLYGKNSDNPDENISVGEQIFILESLKALHGSIRPLNATDFSFTVQEDSPENPEAYDLQELTNRFEYVYNILKDLNFDIQFQLNHLSKRIEIINISDFDNIFRILVRAYNFGISSSLSSLNPHLFNLNQEEEELLLNRHHNIIQVLDSSYNLIQEKLSKVEAFKTKLSTSANDLDKSDFDEIFKNLFINDFKIFPHFKLNSIPSEDKQMLKEQMQSNFSYENTNGMDMEIWLSELAKVREPINHLYRSRMAAEWIGLEQTALKPLQFPYRAGKDSHWIGREVPNEQHLEDKESLVLLGQEYINHVETGNLAGFVIDQWMELIPYRHQQGGMVFNFDQPDAEAPQVILLAVPASVRLKRKKGEPFKAKNWHLDELVAILNDTKQMMEYRAVEPDHIYRHKELAKIVPLLKYTDSFK